MLETNPDMLEHITVETFLDSIMVTNGSPAFALIKCMFKNIYFIPFGMWGAALVEILELQRVHILIFRAFSSITTDYNVQLYLMFVFNGLYSS